ncbi:hypothetical protein F7D08_1326 [Bifidobacterium cebidarum]|uniref:DUF3046 domain-containing protein n=2 Tax=Bifidobacterium cebidarum TaxID=2650773 RepID=A0A6I1GE23_9BIFI|nr:hypothetical protein F7D08_1326 [Bifidobacterium cebidarum]
MIERAVSGADRRVGWVCDCLWSQTLFVFVFVFVLGAFYTVFAGCGTLSSMREREFWELLEEVFGRSYGRSLAQDQRMPRLANMTVIEALDAGEEPRVVWNVLCDQMEVPDSRRWGHDHNAPPLPAA